eukprot:848648_1
MKRDISLSLASFMLWIAVFGSVFTSEVQLTCALQVNGGISKIASTSPSQKVVITKNRSILWREANIDDKNFLSKGGRSTVELSARRPQKEIGSGISNKRREQLGIPDGEREYDLDVALETNTDPLITKIIAGSFILVVIALLVVGVIIPSTADFGEGICSPIQNGGRC